MSSRRWSAAADHQCPRVQGSPPGGAQGPDPVAHRDHLAHADQRAVRDPVGTALDHRHDRHRLGAVQGPPGRQQDRYRLCTRPGQQGARGAADPRRRGRRVRGAAAAAARGIGFDFEAVQGAHGRPSGAWPGNDRGRQVHHLPADGQGRGGRVAHGLDGKVAPSCTDQVPLAGADGYQAMWNARAA